MSAVLDAAFRMVHRSPGGAVSLAPRIGKNPATVSHEVAGKAGCKLGLVDAVNMSVLTGDPEVLNVFAAEMGYLLVPMPECLPEGQDAMHRVSKMAREFADVVTVVVDAASDGVVTDNELASVEREWGELVASGQHVLAKLRSMRAVRPVRAGEGA